MALNLIQIIKNDLFISTGVSLVDATQHPTGFLCCSGTLFTHIEVFLLCQFSICISNSTILTKICCLFKKLISESRFLAEGSGTPEVNSKPKLINHLYLVYLIYFYCSNLQAHLALL